MTCLVGPCATLLTCSGCVKFCDLEEDRGGSVGEEDPLTRKRKHNDTEFHVFSGATSKRVSGEVDQLRFFGRAGLHARGLPRSRHLRAVDVPIAARVQRPKQLCDDSINLVSDVRRFRPSHYMFLGPGSEECWQCDQHGANPIEHGDSGFFSFKGEQHEILILADVTQT